MKSLSAGALGVLALAGAMVTQASAAPEAEAAEVQVLGIGGVRLGVQLQEVASGETGARVVEVTEGSPAEAAGIRPGDVIVEYDGESVRGVAHLSRLVRETPPGREVGIALLRDGERQTLTAAPEERRFADLLERHGPLPNMPERFAFDFDVPGPGPGHLWDFAVDRPRLGLRFQEIEGQLAGYFGVPGGRGVLVVHVDADSPAQRAGVEAGDVLVELAGQRVEDGRDLRRALRDAEPGEPRSLRVLRRGEERTLEVTFEERRPPRPRGEAL